MMLICNADRIAHTNELFKELYILKFPEFVQYKTPILMFHLFHRTLPIHLQNRFTVHSTTRSTRRVNTFVMVQVRTNIKAMFLSVSGVKLWNSLSNNLKQKFTQYPAIHTNYSLSNCTISNKKDLTIFNLNIVK